MTQYICYILILLVKYYFYVCSALKIEDLPKPLKP